MKKASATQRVLLVEDHEGNITFLQLIIESLGHSLHIARNGKQAFEFLAGEPFDLILLDLHLPDMNGNDIAKQYSSKQPDVPIVGISAEVTPSLRDKCRESGMRDLYDKSLTPDIIQKLLEDYACCA